MSTDNFPRRYLHNAQSTMEMTAANPCRVKKTSNHPDLFSTSTSPPPLPSPPLPSPPLPSPPLPSPPLPSPPLPSPPLPLLPADSSQEGPLRVNTTSSLLSRLFPGNAILEVNGERVMYAGEWSSGCGGIITRVPYPL